MLSLMLVSAPLPVTVWSVCQEASVREFLNLTKYVCPLSVWKLKVEVWPVCAGFRSTVESTLRYTLMALVLEGSLSKIGGPVFVE